MIGIYQQKQQNAEARFMVFAEEYRLKKFKMRAIILRSDCFTIILEEKRLKMDSKNYSLAKYACYSANISMAAITALTPMLFMTFREQYGVSYTLLGFLSVICFFTQLVIDLVFSFFSKYFNIHKTLRLMPVFTAAGLLIYALMPSFFPESAYLWLCIGIVIYSVSAGLAEVLISPTVAAMPSENPERDMSKLHSTYAWGVVAAVIINTLFLEIVGSENWKYLPILWSLLPMASTVMFAKATLPHMTNDTEEKGGTKLLSFGVLVCMACIFLGGASECTMTQWVSGFMEKAIGVPKMWGDIFGMAFFAVFLGLGRSLYAKYGRNILKVMLFGMLGAAVCYVAAGICPNQYICLAACVLTGFFTSMLWPGTISFVGEKFPKAGVAVYALMAAGGDAGASVAPQLVGVLTDVIGESVFAAEMSARFNMTTEQLGMRAAILGAAVFPLIGFFLILYMKKYFKNNKGASKG